MPNSDSTSEHHSQNGTVDSVQSMESRATSYNNVRSRSDSNESRRQAKVDLGAIWVSRFLGNTVHPFSYTTTSSTFSSEESSIELKTERIKSELETWEKHYGFTSRAPSLEDFEEVKKREEDKQGIPMRTREEKRKLLQEALEKYKQRLPMVDLTESGDDVKSPFNPSKFSVVYNMSVLPYLKEELPKYVGDGISVGVRQKENAQELEIITHNPVTWLARVNIGEGVFQLLPESLRSSVSLSFAEGKVQRAVGVRYKAPKNPYQYADIALGDSIGSSSGDGTGTAGPNVQIEDKGYRVASYHLFEGHYTSPALALTRPRVHHPSEYDLVRCKHVGSSGATRKPRDIGKVKLTSGDITATRKSRHPLTVQKGDGDWRSVMDWVLIQEGDGSPKSNVVRMTSVSSGQEDIVITKTSTIKPRNLVYSVGRTSGPQLGFVREELTYMDAKMNGTGTICTHEWTIDQAIPGDSENWRREGLGIPGDSGAGVFDVAERALVGQVWGTSENTRYPRVAYISAWEDIEDDIAAKHPAHARPKMPEVEATSAERLGQPLCQECAMERAAYLNDVEGIIEIIRDSGIPAPPALPPAFPTPIPIQTSTASSSISESPEDTGARNSLDDSDSMDVDPGSITEASLSSLEPGIDKATRSSAENVILAVEVVEKVVEKVVELAGGLDEGYFTESEGRAEDLSPAMAVPIAVV